MVEQRAAVVLFSKLTFISTVSCCCHQRTSQGWVSESLECWADVNIRRQPSVHIWYNCGLIMNFFFLLLQFPVLLPIPCLTAVHPWCNLSFPLRVEISWTSVLRYLQLKLSVVLQSASPALVLEQLLIHFGGLVVVRLAFC